MKKLIIFMLAFFLLASCTTAPKDIDLTVDMSERLITVAESTDFIEIAKNVSPAIVGISTSDMGAQSVGSGVCVGSGGYILTNSHVITNPHNIKLHLFNKSTASAKLIYNDSASDLAILKTEQSMPFLPLCEVDSLEVGEEVLAVGTPLSLLLKHTFTKGIVSAIDRTLSVGSLAGEAYMHNLVQHDASINPGNSGGPLINIRGEVVGINTLKISSSEGLGFAIPTKNFKNLLGSLITKTNYSTPYLGAYGFDAEIANYYQLTHEEAGLYILDVAENSPLKKLDVSAGDIITKLNNQNIKNALDLRNALYSHSANDKITLEVIKNDKKYQHKVTLGYHPINSMHPYLELQQNSNIQKT